ncbi:hypothetical protein J6590_081714, partial [Homalodisca vitripennis]
MTFLHEIIQGSSIIHRFRLAAKISNGTSRREYANAGETSPDLGLSGMLLDSAIIVATRSSAQQC